MLAIFGIKNLMKSRLDFEPFYHHFDPFYINFDPFYPNFVPFYPIFDLFFALITIHFTLILNHYTLILSILTLSDPFDIRNETFLAIFEHRPSSDLNRSEVTLSESRRIFTNKRQNIKSTLSFNCWFTTVFFNPSSHNFLENVFL